jgi:hypothetical protein
MRFVLHSCPMLFISHTRLLCKGQEVLIRIVLHALLAAVKPLDKWHLQWRPQQVHMHLKCELVDHDAINTGFVAALPLFVAALPHPLKHRGLLQAVQVEEAAQSQKAMVTCHWLQLQQIIGCSP